MRSFTWFWLLAMLVAALVVLPMTVVGQGFAKKYHPHFDTTPDYLNIAAEARGVNGNPGDITDNYYMVTGDFGGCSAGPWLCKTQAQIADLMKEYHRKRQEANPNSKLLFVLAVGDNFYWMGAKAGAFDRSIKDKQSPEGRAGTLEVFGPELMGVPWFPVMGNHDYGNDDNASVCPDVSPRFVCDEGNRNSPACGGNAPYSIEEQGYDSNQLNVNKGGLDGPLRQNYHMPDYTYYYTIPSLDFELVAMDWNWHDIEGLGGEGPQKSASQILKHCGSLDSLSRSLMQIKDASTELLQKRAAAAEHKNVAIIGHYPSVFQADQSFRDKYIQDVGEAKSADMTVFNFYGHVHVQQCEGEDSNGQCVEFLTGGGGGLEEGAPNGFGAISWSSDGKQTVECFGLKQPDGMVCTLQTLNKDNDKDDDKSEPYIERSIVADEGNDVDTILKTSLENCKQQCSNNALCNSFAFGHGNCHLKDKIVTAGDAAGSRNPDFKTYYKVNSGSSAPVAQVSAAPVAGPDSKDWGKPVPWPTVAPAALRSLVSFAAAGPLSGSSEPTHQCGYAGIFPRLEDCPLFGGAILIAGVAVMAALFVAVAIGVGRSTAQVVQQNEEMLLMANER